MMKKLILLSLAVLGLAALSSCNKSEAAPDLVTYEISVDASMDAPADVPDTKAFMRSMRMLYCFWANSDVVTVYKGAEKIGTLKPQSIGESSSVLKGSITTSGLSSGTELRLLAPKESWVYSNQDGTFSTINAKYCYSMATVAVTSVNGTSVSTGSAAFKNQQAIILFKFLDADGNRIYPETLKIEAASGKLVKSIATDMSVLYGNMEIDTNDDVDEFYVALRNDSVKADTYTLTATVGNFKYIAKKSGVLFENGKFYVGSVTMEEEAATYTVAGAPAAIFGTEWDATNTANDMAKQANGTYVKTYTVSAQTPIALKVLKNHEWGAAGVNNWPEDNLSFTADPGPLTVTFSPETKKVECTYTKPTVIADKTYTVAGSPASVFGTEWDPANTANDMVKQSDGNYAKSYSNVAAGTELQFKVAEGHTWTVSYGYNGGSGNVSHTMSKTGKLTIHFDATTHYVTATED